MTPEDLQFLKDAFQAVADAPLEADDPRYVSLSEARGESVVELLARGIEFSKGESVQFVCGLPGTGTTTQLKRLEGRLQRDGQPTVLYVDPKSVWPISAGTFFEYAHWLAPTNEYVRPLTDAGIIEWPLQMETIREKLDAQATLIVDSFGDPIPFAASVDRFRIPGIHVVYAVPWTFKLDASTNERLHKLGPIYSIPSIQLRNVHGDSVRAGLEALTNVFRQRFDTQRLFGNDVSLTKLIYASGGNPRDCLRLVQEVIRRAPALPVEASVVDAAILSLQNSRLPIPSEAIPLLARIAQTHELTLEGEKIEDVERWADTRLFLQYRNGREWYDVHPLVRDIVLEKARAQAAIAPAETTRTEPSTPTPPRIATPVTLTPDMRVTLTVEHYRALRKVQWTLPRGVSALVGPNGSGKTTLLDIAELLRHTLQHDVTRAIDARGGPGNLRNAYAGREDRVKLGISLDSLSWQLELSPKGAFTTPLVGERGALGAATLFDRNAPQSVAGFRTDDARTLLGRFSETPEGAAFRPLVTLLQGYRFYQAYDLASIRLNGSQMSADEYLHPDGRNVFSVLRNWRDRKETRPRWQFVIDNLRAAFPDTFDDLDFEMAGQTVSGRIVAPRPDVRIATYFAANGWLIALLHLTAVASTEPAGAVAIDEMENGLHPHAIRQLIEAMRDWASQTGISIVLATHSPVVLDQFKSEPDHLFIMEPGRERTPMQLDEIHDPEWLAHFSLGDLYTHDEFGAQRKDDEPNE